MRLVAWWCRIVKARQDRQKLIVDLFLCEYPGTVAAREETGDTATTGPLGCHYQYDPTCTKFVPVSLTPTFSDIQCLFTAMGALFFTRALDVTCDLHDV
jgi:hypothetical protein